MASVTFRVCKEGEYSLPGDNTVKKEWIIKSDGVQVGIITSRILDLNQDFSNPGYSVTVAAKINGVEKEFYRYSSGISNRSAAQAQDNRSSYVRSAKEWAIRAIQRNSQSGEGA